MNSFKSNWIKALCLAALGVGLGGAGIYVGETDDAPGAALLGLLLMLALLVAAVRCLRGKGVAGPEG